MRFFHTMLSGNNIPALMSFLLPNRPYRGIDNPARYSPSPARGTANSLGGAGSPCGNIQGTTPVLYNAVPAQLISSLDGGGNAFFGTIPGPLENQDGHDKVFNVRGL
jgi:hypothetical protein